MKLRIMTYNISSGHHYNRENGFIPDPAFDGPLDLDRCTHVIAGLAPDICGLNEVDNFMERSGNISQTDYIESLTEMKCFFGKAISFPFDPKGAYGNSVLSRFPIIDAKAISIPDPEIQDENAYYETRGITKAVLDINGRAVSVFQTHFGLAVSEKQNAVTTLIGEIDKCITPIILMGDFNIRPSDFLLKPLRERLFDTGLMKNEYFYTWPSYKTDKAKSCKIDYLFLSKEFVPLSLEIPKTCASDHLPYVVEAEF